MIVVDASAVVDVLVECPRTAELERLLTSAGRLVAPDLIFVEVASALWRMVRDDAIGPNAANAAITDLSTLALEPVGHRRLVTSAWTFRHSARINDAYYLACARLLRTSLLSTDARLARGHHGVPVTLVS